MSNLDTTAKAAGNIRTILITGVTAFGIMAAGFGFYFNSQNNDTIANEDIKEIKVELSNLEDKVDRNYDKSNEEFKKILRELLKLSLSLRN